MTRTTRTLALATAFADRLALAAVQQQQQQGHAVHKRDLAAQAITALLDQLDRGQPVAWSAPPEPPNGPSGRLTRTLAIDRALADRLAVAAVQARAQAGHTVTIREVAEVAISQWLEAACAQ